MTKSIKNNLIRFLTFIVAVTCAFSILTMPKTSAMADVNTVGLDKFTMESATKLNVTSLEKSGIQFTAKGSYGWTYPSESMTGADSIHNTFPKRKKVMFGIVIADKYYRDQNGDIQERTNITVDTDNAITISYLDQARLGDGGYYTGGWTYYTGSITYREDKLKADFIAHDEAELLKPVEERKLYFTNGVYNDEEFADLMDKVYAEQLIARAYIKVTTAENETVYVYSENSVSNSVRGVATDKYIENKDDENWMAQYGYIATKYLGTISTKTAYLDKQTNKIIGQDLRGYEEFTLNDASLSVGEDIVIGETSTLSKTVVDGLEEGQTYTLTAIDARGNVLFLNVTPATEVITTAEQFKSIFDLSTYNEKCVDRGSFYSCTVDGYYVLGNDIDMTGVKLDHNLVCAYDSNTAVSAFGVGFYGTFDGNGYTISNLNVARSVANYKMTQTGDFMILNKNDSGVATSTTSSYYPSIAANHSCSHSSGTGVGVFASLGYGATIKNVAFTNVNSSNSSVIAMFTEGGSSLDANSEWGTFAGFEEVDAAAYAIRYSKTSSGVDISTTCTGGTDCPVHGEADCTATQGTKFVKCKGGIGCIHCQTMKAHTPVFYPVVLENSYYNVAIREGKIYNRVEKAYTNINTAKANACINYENLYIDINDQTSSFRGIFNSFGSGKVDAITTINNVVVNYNGANVTANNYGLLRGENKVSSASNSYKDINFGATAINNFVIITEKTANLINYNGNYVASNLEGTNKIAGVLQYASLEEYAAAIEAGTASKEGFGSYWETEKTQTPTWKNDFTKVTFKVDGEVVGNSFDYTALALGEQKTFQVTAYDYKGEQITEFAVAKTTDELVATVNKSGLITVAGSTNKTEASTIITLEANGKTFIATITIQGGFIIVNDKEVTYSQDQGKFNFNGFAVDVDNDDTNDNSVVFNNDTILSAIVINGEETTELTKQTIQVKDYGNLYNGNHWSTNPGAVGQSTSTDKEGNKYGDYAGTGDDTMVNATAFLGENVVKFAVNGEYGVYTPVLYTQKLLVTIQVGEEVRTYVFNNLKAYSAIITNVGQLTEVLSVKTTSTLNKGYYILANNITATRGIYKVTHAAPSGTKAMGFQGVFDGQGYYLNNGLAGSNLGLFDQIVSTEEMPTTIRNVSLTTYAGANSFVGFAKSLVTDTNETVTAADGASVSVSKYPVEFYNVHYKPTTSTVHGLFYANPNYVNYKLRNVVINFENLRAHQTYNNSNYFNSDTYGILLNTPEFQYTGGSQITAVEHFARASYTANPFDNVVILANMPVVGYIGNDVGSQGYTAKEPIDTYYMGYGANKIGKSGMKIARIAQANAANSPSNLANLVFDVLASQTELTALEATPWAAAAATNEYTVTDPADSTASKKYTTKHEQAFFYKGVYQFYNLAEMKTAIALAESGDTSEESNVLNALVAEGMPYKFSAEKTTEGITGRYVQWIQGNN